MSKAVRISAALVLALLFAACRTAPVLTPEISVPTVSTGGAKSAAQVAEAIKRAGSARSWTIAEAGPGHLTGSLTVRGHQAVVDIPYSKDTVKIVYKSSQGLNYADGKIHRNYNKWVNNLAETIRRELANP